MTLFKTIKIGLYRQDLVKAKEYCSLNKLKLKDFKLSSISLQEREETEQIVFYDDDGQQLILKNSK